VSGTESRVIAVRRSSSSLRGADEVALNDVHRYYDPATGQFLTVDPLVNQTNAPYFYAGDDPVNASDPTGLGAGGTNPACTGGGPLGATAVQDRQLCKAGQQAFQQEINNPMLRQPCIPPDSFSLWNTVAGPLDISRHNIAAQTNDLWNFAASHSSRAFSNSLPGGIGTFLQNVWQSLQALPGYLQQVLQDLLNPAEPIPPIG
jgi:hypothetical protein